MPVHKSSLPFYLIMSDINVVGLDAVNKRVGVDNVEDLVRKVVGEGEESNSNNSEELQCGQRLDDDIHVVSDIEEECPTRPAPINNYKIELLKAKNVKYGGKVSRSLKRQHLVPLDADTMSTKKKHKRTKDQTTLLDGHLLPNAVPLHMTSFQERMKTMMKTVTLLHLLGALKYCLDYSCLELIMEHYNSQISSMKTPLSEEAKTLLEAFLTAAATVLSTNHGIRSCSLVAIYVPTLLGPRYNQVSQQ